ncbi:MAG TPA: hypothetical protein EYO33_04505 [Phycisphaerales bacterium]|nr:hypothetical protein [Phycisphaerales bacterium]
MKYTLKYNDIGFNSSSEEVEALRRALEIRSISREMGKSAWQAQNGNETYVWETPLRGGFCEVETVSICERSGTITYTRAEIAQAS